MSDPNQPYGAVPPPSFPPPPPSGPPPGQPYPPPPGDPGGPGDAGGGGRKGLWVALGIIGALALVGVVIGLVLVLTGGDDDESDADADATDASSATSSGSSATTDPSEPSSAVTTNAPSLPPSDTPSTPRGTSSADAVANDPEAVVESFLDAVLAGDCATAEDLVTEAYLTEEGECDSSDLPSDFADQVTYTVGTATVDDAAGTATVPVEVDFAGQEESSAVGLTKVDGLWRINEFDG